MEFRADSTAPIAVGDALDDRLERNATAGIGNLLLEGEWRTRLPGALGRPGMKMAKGFLDSLLRAISSRPEARELDESERLRQEVVGLYEEGLLGEAESAARRLVDLQRETLGEGHPDFASSLSNLALLVQKQGDCESAEPLLRQALEIRRAVLGEQHPDFATSLNNLALLHCERHDLDAAEPLLRQALEIRKQALGEDHPDYATGLSSLALFLCERHDLDAAEPLLRQALEVRKQALGEQHPDTATSLNNLALFLCERHDLDAAEPLLRQALEVRKQALGEQHPDTQSSAGSLASLLARRPGTVETQPPADEPPPLADPEVEGPEIEAPAEDPDPAPEPMPEPAPLTLGEEVPEAEAPQAAPVRSRTGAEMVRDLAALTQAFAEASEALLLEAARMQEAELPPPDESALAAASACRLGFLDLRAEALALAATLEVPTPGLDQVAGLRDLAAIIEVVAVAESRWSGRTQVRQRALEVLDHVLGFSCRDAEDRPHLDDCLDEARTLRALVASSPLAELPAEAEELAETAHPLASLHALVHDPGDLNGESWSNHYAATVLAFGKPLAVAAARGRIVAADQTPPPAEPPVEA